MLEEKGCGGCRNRFSSINTALGFRDDEVCSKSPGYSGRDCLYKDREELLEHTLKVCNV